MICYLAICHAFDHHFITFDGFAYERILYETSEYVLARHCHSNSTFAVTMQGKDVKVYINGTTYTLKEDHTLFVDETFVNLPYKVKHVMHVRKVVKNNREYVHLSAWAGVDIFYLKGKLQLAVNGYYMRQTCGLCGNANYNPTDEFLFWDKQEKRMALKVKKLVSSWHLSEGVDPSRGLPEITPPLTPDDLECNTSSMCCEKFKELSEAEFFVPSRPFLEACLKDVSIPRSKRPTSITNPEESSIEAYILAASAKQIDIYWE